MWKDSRLLVSEANRVHVYNAHNRTVKTNVWYICNIIGIYKHFLVYILQREDMIEDARPILYYKLVHVVLLIL